MIDLEGDFDTGVPQVVSEDRTDHLFTYLYSTPSLILIGL